MDAPNDMMHIEQLIANAVNDATARGEPVDPIIHVPQVERPIPPGATMIPYVAYGDNAHVCMYAHVQSCYDTMGMNPTVERAARGCANPRVRDWVQVLRDFEGTSIHVCDNDASRSQASALLGRKHMGTYDHTRTRDQIIAHKQGMWAASPEPLSLVTIRTLSCKRVNVVTIQTSDHALIAAMVCKLHRGMSMVVMMHNCFRMFAEICLAIGRCFDHAYVVQMDSLYICAHGRNASSWAWGSVDGAVGIETWDHIVHTVTARRSAHWDLVTRISATAIHGVVDSDLLDKTWPQGAQ